MVSLIKDFSLGSVAGALLAILLVVATVTLLFLGRTVPGELWGLDGVAVAFYFRSQAPATKQ